jgi:hypothetical protein
MFTLAMLAEELKLSQANKKGTDVAARAFEEFLEWRIREPDTWWGERPREPSLCDYAAGASPAGGCCGFCCGTTATGTG